MVNQDIPRTVVGLKVENFKRVQAVEIEPDPNNPLVVVSGKNAQGKSSVLDALWAVLQSAGMVRETKMDKPVREGEEKATVSVDLGDIIVTRTWKPNGTSQVKVIDAKTNATYTSPQKLLDSLLGKLSFDPLAFVRKTHKEQVTELLSVIDIDIDLDAIAARRKAIFDERTEIGREIKKLGEKPTIDDTLPEVELSASELIRKITEAQTQASELKRRQDAYTQKRAQYDQMVKEIEELREYLNQEFAEIQKMPHPENTEALQAELQNIEESNAAIRANNQAKALVEKITTLESDYEEHTKKLAQIDGEKATSLKNATFPLEGLSFDYDGVTYKGQPLSQASSAEQLRVSCALAMALNPNIRVVRVTDGSLMDSESRQILADIAKENGFQVWVEMVDESGEVGIVIEDGVVKAVNK